MPVHGETRQLLAQKQLAENIGMDPEHIFISEIGKVLALTPRKCQFVGTVDSGYTYIDGAGIGDIGNVVLKDRAILADSGLVIAIITINGRKKALQINPEIVSRGFVYVNESEELMSELRKITKKEVQSCLDSECYDWATIKSNVKSALFRHIKNRTKRTPMILPVIVNI